MEQSRLGVFLILIIIILLAPDGNSPTQRHEVDDIIAREKMALETLRNSTFGRPGNLTGVGSGDVLLPPELVREQVRKMREDVVGEYLRGVAGDTGARAEGSNDSRNSIDVKYSTKESKQTRAIEKSHETKPAPILGRGLPIYRNISGTIHGEWNRLEIPGLQIPHANQTYHKNITTDHGKITFNIEEKQPAEVQEVAMTMMIKNQEGGDSKDITLFGVHFTKSGEMVLTTSSERFAGIFALPHFTLTNESYNLSKSLLLSSISTAIKKQEDSSRSGTPWQPSSDQFPNQDPRCEYIVYLQLHPIVSPMPPSPLFSFFPIDTGLIQSPRPITQEVIHQIEQELRHPTGAPVPATPPIILSSIIYSPTCGFVLSTQKSKGLKVESYYSKASSFALCAAAVMVAQIWLLIRQMNENNTPSTVSRVSFWTMAMMSVVDGYLTMAFLAVAIFVDSCFLPLVSAAFFSFLLVSVFGMRFLITIYRVQRPERRAAQPTPPAAPAPVPISLSGGGLPLPVSATAQTPLILPPNQDTTNDADDDGRQDIGMLYSRFYFVLLGSVFLSLHATSWPPFFRTIFLNITIILANSFWVPQIYRNIMRGCRKAFTWEFMVGMSFCRVLPVLYIYCWEGNIFYIEPDLRVAAIIIGWVWFQVCALASQEMFGPRFLIPPDLLPPAYDYHPILPIDDLEAADPQMPTSPSSAPGTRAFDCAICMQSVDVPTISSENEQGRGGVGLLGRRGYMVTPCKHVFHSNCLEGWMRFRLQCPICRNPLPPL